MGLLWGMDKNNGQKILRGCHGMGALGSRRGTGFRFV